MFDTIKFIRLYSIVIDTQFLFSQKHFKIDLFLKKISQRPPLEKENQKLLILSHLSESVDVILKTREFHKLSIMSIRHFSTF